MSDNKTLVYLLGAAVVLLAVIAGVLIVNGQSAQVPQPIAGATDPNAAGAGTGAGSGAGMPGVAPSTSFDPKTATKMSGKTADDHVTAYYDGILGKKWDVAFKLQPASSQAGGDVNAFKTTQEGYGLKSFKIISSKQTGNQWVVDVEQDLGPNGKWGVIWTFTKDGNTWLVNSRKVSMK